MAENVKFGNARTVRGDLDAIIEKHADNVISGKVDESKINVLDVVDFLFHFLQKISSFFIQREKP